jgi:hypothetical protein
VISTDITSTIDRPVYRAAMDASGAAVCTVMATQKKSVDHRITAELRVSSFAGGHVWFRPAALDVLVQTTPGHLAWSPPT